MQYDLTINPIKRVRKKKEINWRYKKTNTPKEDLQKFIKIKSKKGKFEDANRLQIKAYTKIHKEYPLVRFYNFRKTARDVAFKFYDNDEFREKIFSEIEKKSDTDFQKFSERKNELFKELDSLLIETYQTSSAIIDDAKLVNGEEGCLITLDMEFVKNNIKEGLFDPRKISEKTKENIVKRVNEIYNAITLQMVDNITKFSIYAQNLTK